MIGVNGKTMETINNEEKFIFNLGTEKSHDFNKSCYMPKHIERQFFDLFIHHRNTISITFISSVLSKFDFRLLIRCWCRHIL